MYNEYFPLQLVATFVNKIDDCNIDYNLVNQIAENRPDLLIREIDKTIRMANAFKKHVGEQKGLPFTYREANTDATEEFPYRLDIEFYYKDGRLCVDCSLVNDLITKDPDLMILEIEILIENLEACKKNVLSTKK